jgi:hypothetical protein
MNNTAILYPIAMQLLLIALIGLLTVTMRRKGALAGEIRLSRFKVMNLEGIEAKYVIPGNSYNNQFQIPMLFIAFVLFALQFQLVDTFFVYASWFFVALRYAHAYVHLTYNNVIHRLLCFASGVLVLFTCWGLLIILGT